MKLCLDCGNKFPNLEWLCPKCEFLPDQLRGFFSFSPELSENEEGFQSKFFDNLVKLEANNFWFRVRNKLIVWALKSYFPAATNFLEIGCGTAFVLRGIQKEIPKLKLYGSEISITGLEHAAKRLNHTTLFQMDARQIPFVEEFDVIGTFDVLEHIQEDEKVLSQMLQAVKPGGGIVLTVPQHQFLWSQQDDYAHHVRRYSGFELTNKVKASGFEIVRMTSFVSLLLPLMFASRVFKKSTIKDYDPLSELKLAHSINFTFEKILDFERLLIQKGLNFPAGGSLLLIAKKPA